MNVIRWARPEPARRVWAQDYRHVVGHLVTVVITVALGVAPLVCDPLDFSSPSFTAMRETPGGMTAWAVAMLVGGAWMVASMAGSARNVRWSLIVTGLVHLFVAVTFVNAQATVDGASPYGWILFGGVALRHGMSALWFPGRPT